MPLIEMICRGCGHIWEEVTGHGEISDKCPQCESLKLEKLLASHGGYFMTGSSASTRPRRAGSFTRTKK